MNTHPEPLASERLTSLDALRGFDMMWIMGADALGNAFSHLNGGAPARFIATQLDHVAWQGIRFYDTIFPLFVFMVGVAIPYSLDRIVGTSGTRDAVWRIARRTVLLYLLGLFYYGGFSTPLDQIRLLGVLQRIALCYCGASLLYLWVRPKALWGIIAGVLIGYWALLTFVPVPGFGAADYSEGHNLTNWIDAHYLPLRKWDGDHDPEGILSTLPAIGTCLLGVISGKLLRDPGRLAWGKARTLAVGGALLMVAGFAWGLEFPVIKKIWSSSFVLVAGGWSMLLLSAFYTVADIWKWDRYFLRPFVWLGSNALAVYILSNVLNFSSLSERFMGGPVSAALDRLWGGLGGLALALVSLALCMAFAGFLYRRKIFIKL